MTNEEIKSQVMLLDTSEGVSKDTFKNIQESVRNHFGIDAATILLDNVEFVETYFFKDSKTAQSVWRRIKNS
jgi:hypothetical protein